jgi:hypothetical protein
VHAADADVDDIRQADHVDGSVMVKVVAGPEHASTFIRVRRKVGSPTHDTAGRAARAAMVKAHPDLNRVIDARDAHRQRAVVQPPTRDPAGAVYRTGVPRSGIYMGDAFEAFDDDRALPRHHRPVSHRTISIDSPASEASIAPLKAVCASSRDRDRARTRRHLGWKRL